MEKKKILIVDDEKEFTEMVKLNLELTGRYDVETVNDAAGAVDTVKKLRPNLILLDIVMPGIDGTAIASRLHDDHQLKDIPIIFVTATITRDEVTSQEGLIGGRRFVSKPVAIDELVKCIQESIGT